MPLLDPVDRVLDFDPSHAIITPPLGYACDVYQFQSFYFSVSRFDVNKKLRVIRIPISQSSQKITANNCIMQNEF